jgi:hypothetical protein
MTTPNLSNLVPLKWKTWVATVSGVLTLLVPYVLEASNYLDSPWPLVVGAVIAVLGALGVYKAPYVAPGQVLAPNTPAVQSAAQKAPPVEGSYTNPWQ